MTVHKIYHLKTFPTAIYLVFNMTEFWNLKPVYNRSQISYLGLKGFCSKVSFNLRFVNFFIKIEYMEEKKTLVKKTFLTFK